MVDARELCLGVLICAGCARPPSPSAPPQHAVAYGSKALCLAAGEHVADLSANEAADEDDLLPSLERNIFLGMYHRELADEGVLDEFQTTCTAHASEAYLKCLLGSDSIGQTTFCTNFYQQ